MAHVCPWWAGYLIDNRFRRWLHNPEQILTPLVQPGMTVLDFGCGLGFFAIGMARLVGDDGLVIAVDRQPQMLAGLRKRAARAGVAERIRTHHCAADALGLDQPVAFALAFYSVHEVRDQGRLFREIHGLLRPGGQFLMVEPIGHVTAGQFHDSLRAAKDIGFQIDHQPWVRWSHAAVLAKPA